jgi:GTPase SAR1 family protein
MHLSAKPLEQKSEDTFTNDVFKLGSYANALANLVENSEDALVISLDGQWGVGKSTFIRRWQTLLEDRSIPNIYIDAFEQDYVDDPFITIASNIATYAESRIQPDKFQDYKNKAKKVGTHLLSLTARIGIKAATLGVIKEADLDAISNVQTDLSKATSQFTADFIEERLSSHAKDVSSIEAFKSVLSELPVQLKTGDKSKPLVIIIDELDRCKPTYALEVIEKIKHLFSIKNIIFILVMNKPQVIKSISNIYGIGSDGSTYLQKFIDIDTKLPSPHINTHNMEQFCTNCLAGHGVNYSTENFQAIVNCAHLFVDHYELTLRQTETMLRNISILYMVSKPRSLKWPILIAFIALLKVIDQEAFERLHLGKISFDELKQRLRLEAYDNPTDGKFEHLIEILKYLTIDDEIFAQECKGNTYQRLGLDLSKSFLDRHQLIPRYIDLMMHFSSP